MPVLRRTLMALRWQVVGYGLGLFAWAVILVLLYPSIRDMYAGMEFPEAYSALFGEAAVNLGDFRNFASVELYQWVPLVVSIYAVAVGTGTLAGDEGRGVLEVLLTQPFSRRRVFLEKVGAMVLGMIAITAIAAVGVLVSVPFVGIGDNVSLFNLSASLFALLPFALLTGSLALLLAAIAPTRGTAAGLVAVVVVASWIAASLAALTAETEWLKYLSGYHYADVQLILVGRPVWWHQLLVVGVTLAQTALALLAFERREIEVATWQLHLRGIRERARPPAPAIP